MVMGHVLLNQYSFLTKIIMTAFFKILNEGGSVFMYTILLLFILILVLIVLGLVNKDKQTKIIPLVSPLGSFTLAWGVLGMTIGLIHAFDSIQAMGTVSQSAIAGGLKVSLIAPVFGLITFLISRIGIIVLEWKNKKEE